MSPSTRKRVVITQSNYLPWKGYFDSIAFADEFVLLDEVQFTKRDWRNRNQIKTPQGPQWLSIPVNVKGRSFQSVWETTTVDDSWKEQHWKAIQFNYARAPYFKEFGPQIRQLYETCPSGQLSQINRHFLEGLCKLLNISFRFSWSHEYNPPEGKTERLVDICSKLGATDYFTGPLAKEYIVEELFTEAGVKLHYFDYGGYRPYLQIHGEFTHNVSVIDLILNAGKEAPLFLKHVEPFPESEFSPGVGLAF